MSEIYADGFLGSLLAAESVLDGMTILHGPGGCRSMAMSMSTKRLDRQRKTKEGDFFFHNSRIACTYVDAEDYIYGASAKVGLVIDLLKSDDVRIATVVESPGASLIGDSISDEVLRAGMSDKTVVIGSSNMSLRLSEGFDVTLTAIADKVVEPGTRNPDRVNVVGLPFIAHGYEFVQDEIRHLLGLMGLDVITFIGAGSTVEELKETSQACANVVVMPEYCRRLSNLYEQKFGIPTVASPEGAPVGYHAVRTWILSVAEATG
ncbi:MAG: hypothetical protein IJ856_05845, partial [Candidatus Methanomethylophilaceae archaeon]|nr:hypothetical protein [Candidatus Methanomethylophilaceae archaeon]